MSLLISRPGAKALPAPRTNVVPTVTFSTFGAMVGVGVGSMMGDPLVVVASCGGAVLCVAASVARHIIVRRRAQATDRFVVAVSTTLGFREPTRACLEVKKWAEGDPVRFVLHYADHIDDTREEWISEIREHARRRLGGTYKLVDHRPRKCQLTFEKYEVDAGSKDFQIERVNTIVQKVLGTGCKVATEFDAFGLKQVTVQYEVNPRLSSTQLRHRVETSITAPLEGRWRAFWDLQHDTVRFEVRPHLDSLIPNPSVAPDDVDPLATYDDLRIPYAVDEDGNVIYWRPKKDPHMLVVGKTGKGKTVVLIGVVEYLAALGWKIWGIDGKRIEFLGLRDYPNVELIAGRIDHQARVAHQIYEMMQQRFADYEAGRVRLEDFEPVLFVIDEFKTFRNALIRWYRSIKKAKGTSTSQPPVLDEISDFVSLARKVRMHLLLGLQRPDAEFLTGDMRDNFNARISLGRLSPDAAKMMFDSYTTGIAVPVNAIGRGTTYNGEGEAVEVQAYWTPDPYQTDPEKPEIWVTPDDLKLVDQIRPKVILHELKQIMDADDWWDLDGDGKDEGPTYSDYMSTRIIAASNAAERPARVAAGVYERKRTAELTKLQVEAEEPTIDDSDIFAGYGTASVIPLGELMDDISAYHGAIALVDPDTDTWGLVDSIEPDLEEDYVAIDYRNLSNGDPSSISLPEGDAITIRLLEK